MPDVVFELMGQTITPEDERTPWIDRLLSVADTLEPVAATGSVGFAHTMPVYTKYTRWGKGQNGQLPTTDVSRRSPTPRS